MAKKQKPKQKTEAEIFSELLVEACGKHGTKTIAETFGVTERSLHMWKKDSSKMNIISRVGAMHIINNL